MDSRLKQALEQFLIESGYCHNENIEVEEEIPVNWDNVEEFGGKKYFKESAELFRQYSNPMYLKEIPAEYFQIRTEKKSIINAIPAKLTDEEINLLIQLEDIKICRHLNNTIAKILNSKKEYKILEFLDNDSGVSNVIQIEKALNNYAKDGWYLKSITTNESGKNSRSVGVSGLSSSVNATIDQTIIILERNVEE